MRFKILFIQKYFTVKNKIKKIIKVQYSRKKKEPSENGFTVRVNVAVRDMDNVGGCVLSVK